MTTLALPTPTDSYPDETIRVQLAGSTYLIRWLWNERGACWAFSMADESGEPIVSGVRVGLGMDLLARTTDERLPPGRILVIDPSGGTEDPTLETLGKRVRVVYWEPSS